MRDSAPRESFVFAAEEVSGMNATACPKPGLARRGASYEAQIVACAQGTVPLKLNRLMVDKALALGTAGELSAQERCLMMALLAHLDIAATAGEETAVWPGSARLCTLLEIGESTLRRLKASLEEKGFILRRYDHLNRPLNGGAIDLKPFLLRVAEICAELGHTEKEHREARKTARSQRYDHPAELSAIPPRNERPIGNPPQQTSERTSGEAVVEEVAVCTDTALAETVWPGISTSPEETAATVLGNRKASSLWPWAVRRHGSRALLGLAVAGKAPHIADPAAWFGWFATSAKGAEADLEGIAKKLMQNELRDADAPPLVVPPELNGLLSALGHLVGNEKALSYVANGKVVDRGGTLAFRAGGKMSYQRLTGEMAGAFAAAASKSGFATEPLPPVGTITS
jgi:hypothetical protein